MRRIIVVLMLVLALAFSACSGGNAKELFETAKFEELQSNKEHAKDLYEEVIKKYPKSEYARQAEERLKTLGGK